MAAAPAPGQQQQLGSQGQLIASLPQLLQDETEDTIARVIVAVMGLDQEVCAGLLQLSQGLQKRALKMHAGVLCLFACRKWQRHTPAF